MHPEYEAVIGLEVHAQLKTRTKAFCSCSAEFGAPPNTQTCPVCLGHPGALPVLNRQVVEFTLRLGIATHCRIRSRSLFARKNYFYPDLPKGYQITQYEEPICTDGWIEIELDDGRRKRIGIARIQMEEDAGKSIHDVEVETLVDLNRCGVPLVEIVSAPELSTPREAYLYLRQIRQLVRYLGICDGNMEEGSLRCDANVSVRRVGRRSWARAPRSKTSTASAIWSARWSTRSSGRLPLWNPAASSSTKRFCGTPCTRRLDQCAPKSTRTTTATFPSQTWCLWW